MRKRRGRLVEILVVIAIISMILIIWAVIIPKEPAYGYRRELLAAKAITVINSAEIQYYSQYGKYATSLAQLGPTAAALIDRNLATGKTDGFNFVLQQNPTGYIFIGQPHRLRYFRQAHLLFRSEPCDPHPHRLGTGDRQR